MSTHLPIVWSTQTSSLGTHPFILTLPLSLVHFSLSTPSHTKARRRRRKGGERRRGLELGAGKMEMEIS